MSGAAILLAGSAPPEWTSGSPMARCGFEHRREF